MSYSSRTPFEAVLNTNYTPLESEVAQLKLLIIEPLDQLSALQVKIQRARDVVNGLLDEERELEAFIQKHRALAHPIRRIPQDVLQEIFYHCLPDDHYPTLDWKAAPLTLTHVCQSWRTVAFKIPKLWSSLHVVIPQGSDNHVQFQLDTMDTWLQAAKGRPVSLSIAGGYHKDGGAFLRHLERHTTRIRTLTLHTDDAFLIILGNHFPSDTAWPQLEKVTLIAAGMVVTDDEGENWSSLPQIQEMALWKAPALKHIAWNSVQADISQVSLNWDCLEAIEVFAGAVSCVQSQSSLSPSVARSLLQGTSNLKCLRIRLSEFDDPLVEGPNAASLDPLKPGPLALPHLTVLNLEDTFIHPELEPIIFLDNLQLPALEHLRYSLVNTTISGTNYEDEEAEDQEDDELPLPWNDPAILRFLRAQDGPVLITAFMIDDSALSRDALVQCLKLMPLLRHLWVDGKKPRNLVESVDSEHPDQGDVCVDANDALLQHFLPDSTGSLLCPHLETVQFKTAVFSNAMMEDFVQSRLDASGRSIIRRIAVRMQVYRPSFVAREFSRGAVCALEESLRAMGVPEVIIEMKKPYIPRVYRGWRQAQLKPDPYKGLVPIPASLNDDPYAKIHAGDADARRRSDSWYQWEVDLWGCRGTCARFSQ